VDFRYDSKEKNLGFAGNKTRMIQPVDQRFKNFYIYWFLIISSTFWRRL
jgi:hypothetical protein